MELVGDLGGPGIWQLGERVKGKPSCTCAQAMSGVCVCVSVCVCVWGRGVLRNYVWRVLL